MAHIPEETLQQILAATDIVDLIGRTVKLRRAGTNWLGLCPFHNEKTPSFNVRPSTNSYHCFGCGAGGNAFRFIMETEGLSFIEAVKRLGTAAGIRIQEEVWDANAERQAKQRALLLRAHQELAQWFHQLLLRSPLAEEARSYLKSRGISATVAKNWLLGYAPTSSQLLRQWARQHTFAEAALVEAGVLVHSEERGDHYPRFRHRLMFPIRNESGEIIAFSGRLLEAEAKAAKYLNSPETALFSKSKVLFGFDRARRAIAKAGQAIVCEGQIDTLMLHEAGFPQAVAGQGTAFTEYHARALKRLADEVVLCYDSDNAGFKAAERTFQILAHTGLNVRVAALPAGEDPDSLIRKQGPEAFATLLHGARDFIDYQLEVASARRDLTQMREKVRFAEDLISNIRMLDSPVARETCVQRVAVRLGVPEDSLRRLLKKKPAQVTTKPDPNSAQTTSGRSAQQLLASQERNALLLCRIALADAQVLDWLRQQPPDDILRDVSGTELLGLLWRGQFDPIDPSATQAFLCTLAADEEAAMSQLLHESKSTGSLAAAQHAFAALELVRLSTLKQQLQTQLKTPGLTDEDISELQREIMALHRDLTQRQQAISRSRMAES
jgi:DNA primase